MHVHTMILHSTVWTLFAVDVPGRNVEVGLQAIQSPHLVFGELEVEDIGVLSDSSYARGKSINSRSFYEDKVTYLECQTWAKVRS